MAKVNPPHWWEDPEQRQKVAKKIARSLKGRPAPWTQNPRTLKSVGRKISKTKTGVKNPKASAKLKGRKLSSQHKEKLRKYKLDNPTRYWLGKKRPNISKLMREMNTGRPLTEETKRKISKALKGKKKNFSTRVKMSQYGKGRNSLFWKGGVSREYKRIRAGLSFRLWRESVFLRDNYTCYVCGFKGGSLHPHHVRNFSEDKKNRFNLNNGKTLCVNCHKKFHKKYGNRNNNSTQLEEFRTIKN